MLGLGKRGSPRDSWELGASGWAQWLLGTALHSRVRCAELPLSASRRGSVADPWTQRSEFRHRSPAPVLIRAHGHHAVLQAFWRGLGGALEGGLGSGGALGKEEREQEGGRKVPAEKLTEARRGCLWGDSCPLRA